MPVFFWRTVARSTAYPLGAMSSTLSATTSQPRSLLSIATLNIARSRVRPAICSLVRIDQTCFGRSGGLAPTNLPLFQGTRFGAAGAGVSLSCMVILLVCENDQHGLHARAPSGVRLLTSNRRGGRNSWQQLMPSRPGEFHPEPLTDPDLILSHHPARAIARRLPPSAEISGSSRFDPVGPSSTAMTRPLCSTGITPLQRYYGAVRPCPAHRYFRPRGWSRLCLFP